MAVVAFALTLLAGIAIGGVALRLRASDVTPAVPANDSRYGRLRDAFPISNDSMEFPVRCRFANGDNPIFGQLGVAVRFASLLPILFYLVIHVVLVSAKKEVFRPNARRVVAGMEDEQPIRDRPGEDFVSDSVGKHDGTPAAAGQFPVPGLDFPADPRYAPVGLLSANVAEKPFDEAAASIRAAISGTEFPPAIGNYGRLGGEWFSATQATAFDPPRPARPGAEFARPSFEVARKNGEGFPASKAYAINFGIMAGHGGPPTRFVVQGRHALTCRPVIVLAGGA